MDDIRQLYVSCQGNLVRVHEELGARGARFSYQALTGFCRRHGIGTDPITPAGTYTFGPGVEMQHDTSPHRVTIGGQVRLMQTASLVLCYSRLIYVQIYPRFTRFWCKVFLTDALQYVGGACATCMIDNTHVVVLRGTGAEMVPVPEMAAFAERFGFTFRAHEKGDANRSARVERPFDFIEHNFLAGRTFADWDDLNRQALAWCDRVNATFSRHLHASRRDLFAVERPQLTPLPAWVPAVYQLHHRIVDTAGYVHVDRTRYSVPLALIGRDVEVREAKTTIEIFQGPRLPRHARQGARRDDRLRDRAGASPRARRAAPAARAVARRSHAPAPRAPARALPDRDQAPTRRAASRASCAGCSAWSATIRARRCSRPSRPPPSTASTISIAWSAWCCNGSRTTTSSCGPRGRTTMTDELAQLLKNLHLGHIAQILDAELAETDQAQRSPSDFLARLLRAQWHHRQETALAWRIKQAKIPQAWTLETFPFKQQPGVNARQMRTLADLDFIPKAENLVFIGNTGRGQDRARVRPPAEGDPERLPRAVCPRAGSLRRDVRLAGGSVLAPPARAPRPDRRAPD